MPKMLLFTLVLTVVMLTGAATLIFNNHDPKGISRTDIEIAVNQARYLYSQQKLLDEDFTNGPCLSNALLPGWVLDIAHRPRQPIDDLPQNQCAAFLEGRAKHFVELDLDGNLIRAK